MRGAPARCCAACLPGTAAIGVVIVLLRSSPAVHDVPAWPMAVDIAVVGRRRCVLLVLLAPAALWEELVFRGYLWPSRRTPAAVVSRCGRPASRSAWCISRIRAPACGHVGIVVLAGVCLGSLRHRYWSVPAAWLAHLAWNWIMAAWLHVPVSGLPLRDAGYRRRR